MLLVEETLRKHPMYPTHRHSSEFWEYLGRAVATFVFLEEILGKAFFAFTATRPYSPEEIDKAYSEWLPKLEKALTDPLHSLAISYGKVVKENSKATIENIDELVEDLKQASEIRNVLCHGSWRLPDANGASVPLFVSTKKKIFLTAIDVDFFE